MSKRSARTTTAAETLRILERGEYTAASRSVSIAADLEAACSRSALYTPEQLEDIVRESASCLQDPGRAHHTAFEVVNESTLHAGHRLLSEGETCVLALNFASARHPGGGFLKGSQAQEESLARASGLYGCLTRHRGMYEADTRQPSCLYTDHMIYAPDVPVFRDDSDDLLEQPYLLSFVTAPAVNAGVVRSGDREDARRIGPVMLSRIEKVLALAVLHSHEVLVLGAWGCGVFGNDPDQVAGWFAEHLKGGGAYHSAFKRVVFAVLDDTADGSNLRPFARRFGVRS